MPGIDIASAHSGQETSVCRMFLANERFSALMAPAVINMAAVLRLIWYISTIR